ncbi:hypothetical protein K1X76_12245 [bacterium]|nr:hypothetical protein [bacterium]
MREGLEAANAIRLKTYWQMGRRLSKSKELASANSAALLAQLAADLNMEVSLLYRIQQFYTLWPKGVPDTKGSVLSWSHFVELLSLKDSKERDFYVATASKQSWSRDQLRKAIQKDYFHLRQLPAPSQAGGLSRPVNPLHTYKAIVEHVVDGDTLLVRIDLGFEVWLNIRTRFRGINTAELVKQAVTPNRADQAKAFVEEKLKDLPFIIIKTYKTDMYQRYVSDIFYHPTLTDKEAVYSEGFFLNAQLLEAKLADLMD